MLIVRSCQVPAAAISMDKFVWSLVDELSRVQDRISLDAADDPASLYPETTGLLAKDGMLKPLPDSDAHTWREPVPSALCTPDRSRAHDGSVSSQSAINIHASAASPAARGRAVAQRVEPPGHTGTCPVVSPLTGLHPSRNTVRPPAPTVARRRPFPWPGTAGSRWPSRCA